jgi:hypothetical protein
MRREALSLPPTQQIRLYEQLLDAPRFTIAVAYVVYSWLGHYQVVTTTCFIGFALEYLFYYLLLPTYDVLLALSNRDGTIFGSGQVATDMKATCPLLPGTQKKLHSNTYLDTLGGEEDNVPKDWVERCSLRNLWPWISNN